ncbi:MAG: MazG family protein [Deltaproteobacteria bacterium]|nr:MazG family protein [Deltaproteobacteria bacterium]MCL5792649.1 MazG family protein [Deltaproteobacteria bacterium]
MRSFDELVEIMDTLRSDKGCPWDKAQDIDSLKRYVIEEAYEVTDAIESGKYEYVKEELGDLILQVVFIARIAREKGWFNIEDVLNGINKKLIHRHPHVFGDTNVDSKEDVLKNWGKLKHKEKGSKIFDVPLEMPSLFVSYRLLEKAKRLGLNTFKKNKRAANKLRYKKKGNIEKALTDAILSIVSISMDYDINPEELLRAYNKKLINDFKMMAGRIR